MNDQERELRDRFRGLDLPEAPASITRVLDATVRSAAPDRRGGMRRPVTLALIAAVVAGAGLFLASGSLTTPTTPVPYPSIATASAAPTQTPVPAPRATVDGLPIMTVSELLNGRSSGTLSDGKHALTGWWSIAFLRHSCAAPPAKTGALELWCSDGDYGITERNEPAMQAVKQGGDYLVRKADGPVLTPYLSDAMWREVANYPGPVNGQTMTVPIVVMGHFDDPLAAKCRPEARQLCLDRFVIDRVVEFDPASAPTPAPTPSPTPFPFNSPPPLTLDLGDCSSQYGTRDFSFVGWMSADDLTPQLASGARFVGDTLAVAITREPVELARRDDAKGRHYRVMGRAVCIANEGESVGTQYDAIAGSLNRLYDDGREVPTDKATR